MKRILVVSGSRADWGLLEWPIKKLQEDSEFSVRVEQIWGYSFQDASENAMRQVLDWPDLLLVLGDRFEIMATVTQSYLQRIPIAHIAGGDVTEGSYDDAMRDCISRMASIHFVTSTSAMARLTHMGLKNIHLVGNPGIDYIKHADWKKERPIHEPYIVVSYQAETMNQVNQIVDLIQSLPQKHKVFILPNPDLGSGDITNSILAYTQFRDDCTVHKFLPHDEFLNLIFHCDEFIGNSSSMLYEAPELGVKTRMVGNRQKGRTIPWGDGHASERIVKILKYTHL